MQDRRRTFLVDQFLQRRMARQIAIWWLVGGILVLGTPVALNLASGFFIGNRTVSDMLPEILMSLSFPLAAGVVLILYGMRLSIRFSNRIAGPLYRINREMTNLLNDGDPKPLHLRKDDFLTDIADNFNALARKHKELKTQYESLLLEHAQETGILDTIKDLAQPGDTVQENALDEQLDEQLDQQTDEPVQS